MTPNTIRIDASSTLQQINQIVAQTEAIVGPLIVIANNSTQTTLTFDSDPPAPANAAVIAADKAGQSTTPAGSVLVCRGVIFIAGVLVPATAARPAP